MRFKTRDDFIKEIGIRKLGLVDYIYSLEQLGKSEREIQGILLEREVSKSPRSLDMDWKFYKKVKPNVGWK